MFTFRGVAFSEVSQAAVLDGAIVRGLDAGVGFGMRWKRVDLNRKGLGIKAGIWCH